MADYVGFVSTTSRGVDWSYLVYSTLQHSTAEWREFQSSLLIIIENKAVKEEGEVEGKRWGFFLEVVRRRAFPEVICRSTDPFRPPWRTRRDSARGWPMWVWLCYTLLPFYECMVDCSKLMDIVISKNPPSVSQKCLRLIGVQGTINTTRGMLQRTLWSIWYTDMRLSDN